jgi:hypothetical protein
MTIDQAYPEEISWNWSALSDSKHGKGLWVQFKKKARSFGYRYLGIKHDTFLHPEDILIVAKKIPQ